MTDAEITTWCAWFVSTAYPDPTGALPEDAEVSPQGRVSGYAFSTCGDQNGSGTCEQRLSINHCEANLRLSACQATVDLLSDCAATVPNRCVMVGRGCDAYLAQPGCGDTIVNCSARVQ